MKRAAISLLFGMWVAVALAGVQLDYSGLFPASRSETMEISNYMLLDKPKKLSFEISDAFGKPYSGVRVTEVSLTSDPSVSFKNSEGIKSLDLAEAGIYEIKVTSATGASGGELRFKLKVIDGGELLVAAPPAKATPTAGTAESGSATATLSNVPTNVSTNVGGQADASESLPPVLVLVPPQAASVPPTITIAVPPPTVSPSPTPPTTTPDVVSVTTVPTPPAPTAVPTPAPTATSTTAPAAVVPPPSPSTSGTMNAVLVQPAGKGYADPYKPVEVQLGTEIPLDTRLDTVLRVSFIGIDGTEREAPGRCFPAGRNGIRFLPSRLLNGAVYQVKAFHPVSKQPLGSFRFSTIPELKLGIAGDDGQIRVDLSWQPHPDLMPTEDAQVIGLDNVEMVFSSAGKPLFRFPLGPNLPPVGDLDGIRFQGRPFGFALSFPKTRLQGAEEEISLAVSASFAGRDAPVEVVRARFSRTVSTGGVPVHTPGVSSQTTALIQPRASETAPDISSEAAWLADAPADDESDLIRPPLPSTSPVSLKPPPASPTVAPLPDKPPVKPVVILKPVVPIPDPGPNTTCTHLCRFPISEPGSIDPISWPKSITWGPSGSLWVVDSQTRRILNFSEEGQFVSAFGKKGKGLGFLSLPVDVDVSREGIFVPDTAVHCVHFFDILGNPVRDIGTWGVKMGQLDLPHGVKIDGNQLWVVDRGNCRVMRFSTDGTFRSGFGRKGELPGYLDTPTSIHIHQDKVWILEGDSGRLQWFSKEGKFGAGFSTGTKDANNLEVDCWGYPWVSDGEGHRVARFDPSGRQVLNIGSPDPTVPWTPTGVAVRADGLVAVGDGKTRSIHIFRLQKL